LLLALSGCRGARSGDAVVALVTVETLSSSELGCGGDPDARTPNLDRLARRGTQIVHAAVPGPSVETALASYLTGGFPADHGVFEEGFATAIPTVTSALLERHVATGSFCGSSAADTRSGLIEGFRHNVMDLDGPNARRVGEPWNEVSTAPTDSIVSACVRWLERTNTAAFAWVHASDPHAAATSAHAAIAELDRHVGRVWRALRRTGRTAAIVVGGTGEDAALLASSSRAPAPELTRGPVPCTQVVDFVRSHFGGVPFAFHAADVPPPPTHEPSPARERARAADRAGDLDAALAEYARVIEEEPGRVSARYRWAELALMTDDERGARDMAQQVLDLVPHHAEARVLLARTWAESEPRRARRFLDPVLAWYPSHAEAHAAAAAIAIASGDHSHALRELRLGLAGAGVRTEVLVSISGGFSRVGFHGEALSAARAAIRLGDERPRTRYALAYALEKAERFSESVTEYRSLLREYPAFLPPYRNLGSIMARDGETERAILLWESALRYHPDDAGIKTNLEEARRAMGLKVVEG
jgi:tetratricopeptide (TPR) repeat protein